MDWREHAGGEMAWAGERVLGFVVAMHVPASHPEHGRVAWSLSGVGASDDDISGFADDIDGARAALEARWARWLDERGLVAAEDVARVLRDAMPKRRG